MITQQEAIDRAIRQGLVVDVDANGYRLLDWRQTYGGFIVLAARRSDLGRRTTAYVTWFIGTVGPVEGHYAAALRFALAAAEAEAAELPGVDALVAEETDGFTTKGYTEPTVTVEYRHAYSTTRA